MCFNEKTKVLSIHLYISPYSYVDVNGLTQLMKYIDNNFVGQNTLIQNFRPSKICLKRNLKALAHKKPSKDLIISHCNLFSQITHKTVFYIY